MTSLLAASRQDLAAAYGFHTRTEPVRLGAAAFARLKCALWQSNPPLLLRVAAHRCCRARCIVQAALAAESELSSLLVHGVGVKKTRGSLQRGKSDTASESVIFERNAELEQTCPLIRSHLMAVVQVGVSNRDY